MPKKTALYQEHLAAGAKLVDFSGWYMPLHYGSQLEEHHQVRRDSGVFDVSHMTVLDLKGTGAHDFLRYLLANDIGRLKEPGKALYSCMLKPDGGVIDDLITYFLNRNHYRMVVNAATREKDLEWINTQAQAFDVVAEVRDDLSMLAVQGPNARKLSSGLMDNHIQKQALGLGVFQALEVEDWFIARTGYTGEDGFEIMLPNEKVVEFWQQLIASGVQPVGLGARDTLRLEAGLNLYGTDMDETISPLECGLGWTVAWTPESRDFVGREALIHQRQAGSLRRFVGLVLEDRGVFRSNQRVIVKDVGEGQTTSGTFSPTLGVAIALARVPADTGETCEVEVRGKLLKAKVVKPPFVRHGRSCL
ncbi:glycine cleavage system aminomethyltransferase GcvT [Acidihalobacter prosperus]